MGSKRTRAKDDRPLRGRPRIGIVPILPHFEGQPRFKGRGIDSSPWQEERHLCFQESLGAIFGDYLHWRFPVTASELPLDMKVLVLHPVALNVSTFSQQSEDSMFTNCRLQCNTTQAASAWGGGATATGCVCCGSLCIRLSANIGASCWKLWLRTLHF